MMSEGLSSYTEFSLDHSIISTYSCINFFFLPSRGPSGGDILGNSTAPDLVIQSKIKIDPGPYLACVYHNDSKLKTQQPMSISGAGEVFHPSKLEDMIHSLKLVALLTNILFNNCFWFFFFLQLSIPYLDTQTTFELRRVSNYFDLLYPGHKFLPKPF